MSKRLWLLLGLMALAAALLFMRLPTARSYSDAVIENAGHMPLFALVTFGVLLVLRHDLRIGGMRLHGFALLIGLAGGFLSEVIQRPMHRDASWEDVASDSIGVLFALGVFALFDRRERPGGFARAVAAAVALGCLVYYVSPIVRMVHAYVHRNGEFPVLADFNSDIEIDWTVGYGAEQRIENGVLVVRFSEERWPGVSFHEPVPDWRSYRKLLIDVENPDAQALALVVRVHDLHHDYTYIDRFNREYTLAPGERRTIEILLDDILHGPRKRLMDMAQISDVTLFRGVPGAHSMIVHSLRLE